MYVNYLPIQQMQIFVLTRFFFFWLLIHLWVSIEVPIGTIVNMKVYDVICKLTIYMKLKTFKTKVKLKDADSLNKVQFSK